MESNPDSESSSSVEPLYITVGPPACGKSYWIAAHRSSGKPVRDICLDDQPDVYIPIKSQHFLRSDSSSVPRQQSDDDTKRLKESWFGRTLRQRIIEDNIELKLIAQRCAGQLSKDEMRDALSSHIKRGSNNHNSPLPPLSARLIRSALECYEAVLAEKGDNLALPDTTDLFIVEGIFKTHPVSNQSALDATYATLSSVPSNEPTSWGNTNTKATDYRQALLAAAKQGRPVYFVVYNALDDLDRSRTNGRQSETPTRTMETDLESIGFEGLLRRNLTRYLESGRYVPIRVIWDMLHRTNLLLKDVLRNAPPSHRVERLQRDQALVALSGLQMMDNRTIRKQQHSPRRPVQNHASSQGCSHSRARYSNHGRHSNSQPNRWNRGSGRGFGGNRNNHHPGQILSEGRETSRFHESAPRRPPGNYPGRSHQGFQSSHKNGVYRRGPTKDTSGVEVSSKRFRY